MNRLDQHLSSYLGQIVHGLGSWEGARRDSLELDVTEGIGTIPFLWASFLTSNQHSSCQLLALLHA